VFNRLATHYGARPAYPASLVARLFALAGGRDARIVDVGAGTGHLALPLAAAGARVTAVEPARAMLRVLSDVAGGRVRCVHASGEATTLPGSSQDLGLVADALHWLDPEAAGRELARVVVGGGVVAVVEARLADSAFSRALEGLLAAANFKARRAAASANAGRLVQLLAAAGGRRAATERFDHSAALSPGELDAVLRSLSYVGPALGPEVLAELLARARELAGDAPLWTRELTLTWAYTRP
jgi:SAM-dependent methyltransferase